MAIRAVFVHLGKSNPRHLWGNLRRHSELFPNTPTTLILSERKHYRKVPPGIDVIFYERQIETGKIFGTLSANPTFRQGFWHLTLERLLALQLVHAQNPDDGLLHIESDVLLMPCFPWTYFEKAEKLMWGEASAVEDIAALIFSPSPKATASLATFTLSEASRDQSTNDMKTLRAFRNAHPTEVQKLPISPEEPTKAHGIFDVLAIGMWLGGMDPSNARGLLTYHISMPHHSVQASRYTYTYKNQVLVAHSGSKSAKVHTLHVHSKDMRLFGSNWSKRLQSIIELANKHPEPLVRFSPRGFFSWAREFAREVTSVRFLKAVIRRVSNWSDQR